MAYYLSVTIGFVMCLGMVVGFFVYYLSLGLGSNDSTKVDPLESDQKIS
ncbi:hypothetical protein [Paenisporosarcina antarctica]|nr:hypothetical protein [Paenisporosarcina antarctica]